MRAPVKLSKIRLALAVLIGPPAGIFLAGLMLAALEVATTSYQSDRVAPLITGPIFMTMFCAPISYLAMMAALPVLVIFEKKRWNTIIHFLIAGAVMGTAALLICFMPSYNPKEAAICLLSGLITATIFYVIIHGRRKLI